MSIFVDKYIIQNHYLLVFRVEKGYYSCKFATLNRETMAEIILKETGLQEAAR